MSIFLTYITAIDSATLTITVASMPSQYQFLSAINVLQMSANRHLQGADGDTLKTLSDQIDGTATASALATVDGIVDALALVAPDNKPTVDASGNAAANVALWNDAVAPALLDLDTVLETPVTLGEALRVMLAALAGKTDGSGTPALTFLGQDGATVRIAATVDGLGNRTALTLDGAEA